MLPKISRYPGHISTMSISTFLLSMPLFLLADVITLNTEADQQHRAATYNLVSPRGASFQNNGGVFSTSVTGKLGGPSCASLPPSAPVAPSTAASGRNGPLPKPFHLCGPAVSAGKQISRHVPPMFTFKPTYTYISCLLIQTSMTAF